MGILKHWPAFVFAMAVLAVVGPARGQQIQPEEFTIRHGLSQGYIACMLQDREGFLWAGTKNGLNRFDGRRFQVFVNDPANPFSISHDYVNTLFEHGDFLLVGTNGGSLNIFHKKTRRFFRMPDSLPGGRLSALSVIKVAVDAQGDICLIDWKTVLEGNLYHIRLPQGFWERLERGEAGWAGAFIRKVSDDDIANFNLSRDGRRLYYTKAGALEEVDLKTGALRTHPHPGIQHACRILVPGPNNLVWISGKNGLLQFDGQTWTLLKAGLRASWMAVSPSGDYLLFNDPLSNGVYRCALSEYNGLPRPGDVSLLAKVSDFSTALADRSGNVWIGTGGVGLMKTSVQTSRFRTYFAGESISSPPFSTEDGGYAYIWEKENPVRITLPGTRHPVYLLQKKFAGLGLRARYLRDHQGNHWLYYQKSGQNNLVRIPAPGGGAPRSYAFKTGEVHLGHFAADTDGQIYIGLNGVLYRFNPKTEQFTEHVYQAVQPRGSEVRSLAKTPDGRWWLGTFRGLVEAQPNTTGDYDFRLWQYEPGDTNSLRNNDISSLLPDPNDPNFLWIGTKGGGLARMDINSGAFKHLTTRDGLPNDVIYAVLADEQGYLWLSSNKGLIRYQPESGQIKNFTEADGLQSDEFNTWAYGKTPGGELMFGGVKGLNVFHPKDIVDNPNLPPVFLTGLKISNRAVTSGDSTGLLTQTLEFTEKIRLPFSQNNITLEFAALEYTVPSKNRFRYYLEGAEAEWAHEGSEPSAQYLSLAPGNYTFKVIACNNDGVWNPVPATLHITVLPPWYRSWWAWLFYAAAIGALIYLYMRFRIGQIHLQQSLALEQQEAERVRELDEFKSRLFTNITHEFRTPLTVVLGTSEQLEKQVSELAFPDLKTAYAFAHELKNRLALIRRNGRNLLDLVNQLLDLAKAESNQLKIHLVQGDVVRYIRYIAESFHSLSNQRNVLLTVDNRLPEMVMDYDPEKLRQILSNLISNA
jgi:sugar lactone lactonase YvrE